MQIESYRLLSYLSAIGIMPLLSSIELKQCSNNNNGVTYSWESGLCSSCNGESTFLPAGDEVETAFTVQSPPPPPPRRSRIFIFHVINTGVCQGICQCIGKPSDSSDERQLRWLSWIYIRHLAALVARFASIRDSFTPAQNHLRLCSVYPPDKWTGIFGLKARHLTRWADDSKTADYEETKRFRWYRAAGAIPIHQNWVMRPQEGWTPETKWFRTELLLISL